MKFSLKKYIKSFILIILNNVIFISIILLDYNISFAICKYLNIKKDLKLSIRSFGIVYDITIVLVLIELFIVIFIANNIRNKKNKVIHIKN